MGDISPVATLIVPRYDETIVSPAVRLHRGNIEVAIRAQTIISMAEMSERMGEMVYFDRDTKNMSNGSGNPLETMTYGTMPLS